MSESVCPINERKNESGTYFLRQNMRLINEEISALIYFYEYVAPDRYFSIFFFFYLVIFEDEQIVERTLEEEEERITIVKSFRKRRQKMLFGRSPFEMILFLFLSKYRLYAEYFVCLSSDFLFSRFS